jgi:cytochrome c oxidase assembly factor CtaG
VSTPLAVVLVPMHATPDDQPPPLTALRLLTEWSLDWWLVVGLAIPAVLYAAGLFRLRRRGDHWPVRRSVAFFGGGLGTAAIATLSGLGAYDTVLFSVHVVQHMILMMVTPMFMALGAPVTLALRTLPWRPRTVLLSVLHSRPARVLTFAPLALALFIATPFALYFSSFYELSLRSAFWHAFLHIHFVIIGSLLMWPLTGIDPLPGRMSYPMRLLIMFLMLPFHAFLGISIMSSTRLIAEDWYLAFNRTWPPSPLDDQYLAGAIMWGSGDITALFVLAALFVQWFAHSQREARRVDRQLDRLDEQARRTQLATPAEPLKDVSSEGGRPPLNPPKSVMGASIRPPANQEMNSE